MFKYLTVMQLCSAIYFRIAVYVTWLKIAFIL